jgi:hypothetical protein
MPVNSIYIRMYIHPYTVSIIHPSIHPSIHVSRLAYKMGDHDTMSKFGFCKPTSFVPTFGGIEEMVYSLLILSTELISILFSFPPVFFSDLHSEFQRISKTSKFLMHHWEMLPISWYINQEMLPNSWCITEKYFQILDASQRNASKFLMHPTEKCFQILDAPNGEMLISASLLQSVCTWSLKW